MKKDKTMTAEEIKQRPKDFVHNKYEHGGSRIFVDGESGDRQLIVDTYYDRDFAEYIERCVRDYFYSSQPKLTNDKCDSCNSEMRTVKFCSNNECPESEWG